MRPSLRSARHVWVGLATCVSIAGCGSSAPTRLFTIEPSSVVPAAPTAYAGPPVRVQAVRVPPSWDRLEIVREVAPGQLELLEFDRWAAPLGRSLRQVLVENLAARLPRGAVVVADAGNNDGASLTVEILSIRIEAGTAVMQAGWAVRAGPARSTARHAETFSVPTVRQGAVDAAATAGALSALMGRLADRIADTLAADAGPAGPRSTPR